MDLGLSECPTEPPAVLEGGGLDLGWALNAFQMRKSNRATLCEGSGLGGLDLLWTFEKVDSPVRTKS